MVSPGPGHTKHLGDKTEVSVGINSNLLINILMGYLLEDLRGKTIKTMVSDSKGHGQEM